MKRALYGNKKTNDKKHVSRKRQRVVNMDTRAIFFLLPEFKRQYNNNLLHRYFYHLI